MKKILFLAIGLCGILQLHAQMGLKLTPANPKQNSSVAFEYDDTNSALEGKTDVNVVVYQFNADGFKVTEPVATRKGNVYSGTVQFDPSTNFIAFGFSSGEDKDLNRGKGFLTPVYTDKNIPVQGYYAAAANFQNIYGQNLLGLPVNTAEALRIMQEGMKQYPGIKTDMVFFNTYIATLERSKSTASQADVEMSEFAKRTPLTEQGYRILIQSSTKHKNKEQADSLTAAMKAAFPKGEWQKWDKIAEISNEKSAAKKAALYTTFIETYPQTEKEKMAYDNMKSRIANTYAAEKNYTAYNEWNNKLDKATAASNNNNIAWNMAEDGEHMEEAKKMAMDATMYTKAEMEKPTGKKPETMTAKQWEEQRKNNYAMYGDTYAFILYKMGDYATAFPISKDAATINKLKDAELNERYAMLAEKVLPTADAKKLIEGFVKDNVASSKTKESLKNLYVKENKDEKGFDEYMSKLEAIAKQNRKEEIARGILNEAAPKFTLKDFEGKSVSLDDMKGKTLIVDFWATWCGPCIRSMPGMNKAMAKYSNDPNVKFLFVDTWETVDDKLKNAQAFMEKKKYPFYVLMDNDNRMVEDFAVSGIPTKFVIDKNGKIRFKTVGFGGNDDDLVDELSTMIELASR